MIVLNPVSSEGFTHASIVMPLIRSRELASLMFTKSFAPSNKIAEPYFPAGDQAGPLINVPVLLLPELSYVIVPVFSLKPYAATRLVFETVTIIPAEVVVL